MAYIISNAYVLAPSNSIISRGENIQRMKKEATRQHMYNSSEIWRGENGGGGGSIEKSASAAPYNGSMTA